MGNLRGALRVIVALSDHAKSIKFPILMFIFLLILNLVDYFTHNIYNDNEIDVFL